MVSTRSCARNRDSDSNADVPATQKQSSGSNSRKRSARKTKSPKNLAQQGNTAPPKSRTRSSNKDESDVKPAVVKRRSSSRGNTTKAKRARKSEAGWKKDMREAVISAIEHKTGHASELRQLNQLDKPMPVFAAEGVTVLSTTPSTNKFAKAHERRFDKMESIDDYQKRKQERTEKLFGSSKKQTATINRLSQPKTKTPVIAKPVTRPKPDFSSPLLKKQIPLPAFRKSATGKQATFKPTVTSTSKINTNFASKASKLVTPKRVTVSFAKLPEKQSKQKQSPKTPVANNMTSGGRKTLTPYRQNTPQMDNKNNFNLEESLKKPISWVPHKGPLKKFQDTTNKVTFRDRVKNLKKPNVTTREKRRQNMKNSRTAAKSDKLMKRRGIK